VAHYSEHPGGTQYSSPPTDLVVFPGALPLPMCPGFVGIVALIRNIRRIIQDSCIGHGLFRWPEMSPGFHPRARTTISPRETGAPRIIRFPLWRMRREPASDQTSYAFYGLNHLSVSATLIDRNIP